MSHIRGTHQEVRFSRVVDGDTIYVRRHENDKTEESIRLLCLDTEESNAYGTKPVTPLGDKAKKRANNSLI